MKRAWFAADCILCGQWISKGDPIAPHHGHWVHALCSPGADDE